MQVNGTVITCVRSYGIISIYDPTAEGGSVCILCVQQNFVFSITTSPEGKTITRARILVQVTIYRGLLIGQDCHLDQYES